MEMVFDPVETAQARCPIPANSFFLGTSSSPEPTRITRPPNLPEMLGQFCSMEIEARITGWRSEAEGHVADLARKFTDHQGHPLDLSEWLPTREDRELMVQRVLVLYVDELPADRKFCFLDGEARERILTRDHKIASSGMFWGFSIGDNRLCPTTSMNHQRPSFLKTRGKSPCYRWAKAFATELNKQGGEL